MYKFQIDLNRWLENSELKLRQDTTSTQLPSWRLPIPPAPALKASVWGTNVDTRIATTRTAVTTLKFIFGDIWKQTAMYVKFLLKQMCKTPNKSESFYRQIVYSSTGICFLQIKTQDIKIIKSTAYIRNWRITNVVTRIDFRCNLRFISSFTSRCSQSDVNHFIALLVYCNRNIITFLKLPSNVTKGKKAVKVQYHFLQFVILRR